MINLLADIKDRNFFNISAIYSVLITFSPKIRINDSLVDPIYNPIGRNPCIKHQINDISCRYIRDIFIAGFVPL